MAIWTADPQGIGESGRAVAALGADLATAPGAVAGALTALAEAGGSVEVADAAMGATARWRQALGLVAEDTAAIGRCVIGAGAAYAAAEASAAYLFAQGSR